jgi:hypothetical protein
MAIKFSENAGILVRKIITFLHEPNLHAGSTVRCGLDNHQLQKYYGKDISSEAVWVEVAL